MIWSDLKALWYPLGCHLLGIVIQRLSPARSNLNNPLILEASGRSEVERQFISWILLIEFQVVCKICCFTAPCPKHATQLNLVRRGWLFLCPEAGVICRRTTSKSLPENISWGKAYWVRKPRRQVGVFFFFWMRQKGHELGCPSSISKGLYAATAWFVHIQEQTTQANKYMARFYTSSNWFWLAYRRLWNSEWGITLESEPRKELDIFVRNPGEGGDSVERPPGVHQATS